MQDWKLYISSFPNPILNEQQLFSYSINKIKQKFKFNLLGFGCKY